ncbi:FeoB-associated Cys-rich membrane protein [Sporofaciens sp. SGI.106]|nr:FeoB-associated Cys-rich membrane protein [Lachnoclostridium sp.]
MGTAIVLVILAGVLGIIIRSVVKDKKAGKSLQCGQDCKHCSGHCH